MILPPAISLTVIAVVLVFAAGGIAGWLSREWAPRQDAPEIAPELAQHLLDMRG